MRCWPRSARRPGGYAVQILDQLVRRGTTRGDGRVAEEGLRRITARGGSVRHRGREGRCFRPPTRPKTADQYVSSCPRRGTSHLVLCWMRATRFNRLPACFVATKSCAGCVRRVLADYPFTRRSQGNNDGLTSIRSPDGFCRLDPGNMLFAIWHPHSSKFSERPAKKGCFHPDLEFIGV